MPNKGPGGWDLHEIYRWRHQSGRRDEVSGKAEADRRAKLADAQLKELKLAQQQGQLIPRDVVHEALSIVSDQLRSCGEKLEKHHGRAALRLLNDTIDTIERSANAFLKTIDDSDAKPSNKKSVKPSSSKRGVG